MIELNEVSKSFGSLKAVNSLTLKVEPGEVMAFLGPNGAGKTTTMKMAVGLMNPDRGSIKICGHDLVSEPVLCKKSMAYVPDEPHLYEKLTGREFLELVGRIHGLSTEEALKRADEVTAKFDMGEFIDGLAEGYSHGMRQRVVFGSVLLHKPSVLFVDEPMVGLDPLNARRVKDLFREFAAGGGAVLVSTHIMEVAQEIADSISILHQGNIILQGSVSESVGQKKLEDVFLELTGQ